MTIGYIGASGLMGHGMAKNLIAKGQKLAITVHKQRDRVKDLLDAGATLADNAAALGASCVIMVGATKASFAKIEPVLKCCAENVFHVGEPR